MNRERLLNRLIQHEGLRLFPYDDATGKEIKTGDVIRGKITIGIGFNIQDRGIPRDLSIGLANADIIMVEEALDLHLPWWRTLSAIRQEVVAELCFALGWPKFSQFKKMLAALQGQDYERAADEIRNSLWATQVGKRADTLELMMREG